MGMDQAAGLRKWATTTPRPSQEACPDHVAEMLVTLGGAQPSAPSRPTGSARPSTAPRPARPPGKGDDTDGAGASR
ncbi:hypothetical protein [Halomonas sp. BC04]|uniref:hypothetical protein n=1 Tax=Halomonas sp. BC04 TaxID=1403540 RepID=UPI0012DC83D0|nr:hypothetical protein [Halomonas sp. BC04]